jgi:RHS repeat-associated protein
LRLLGGSYGAFTDSTGFVKIGERFYDPSLARWTQQGPLALRLNDPRQWNRYTYAGFDPINLVGPSGTSHCTRQLMLEIG